MEPIRQFQILGIALLLGLLVGLQREVTGERLAGFRTFPLITLLGAMCGLMGQHFGVWVPALGFTGLLALSVLGNLMAMKTGKADPGVTTEVAVLLMYTVGAYLVVGPLIVGVAVGGAVAILLYLKPELHQAAARLERGDLKAIMQFVLVSCIVLPIVPNRTYGPFDVFNPYLAWFMVVMIVGISLAGYLTYRLLGCRAGISAGGLLGGLISSTATTVTYARLARSSEGSGNVVAVVIMLASTVLYARVLMVVGLIAPSFLATALVPVLLMSVGLVLLTILKWRRVSRNPIAMPVHKNPSELKTALAFAAVYTFVLFLVAAAREYWGERGLMLVAGVTGLTDLDAITVSTSQMVKADKIPPGVGWRLIATALIANTLFKGAVAVVLGGRELGRKLAAPLGIPALVGAILIWLW